MLFPMCFSSRFTARTALEPTSFTSWFFRTTRKALHLSFGATRRTNTGKVALVWQPFLPRLETKSHISTIGRSRRLSLKTIGRGSPCDAQSPKATRSTPAFSTQRPTSRTFFTPPKSHFQALSGRRSIRLTRIYFAESYFTHCFVAWVFSLCDTRMARRSMGRILHFQRTLHLAHTATTGCKRRQEASVAASTLA